jgi:hypothetical protein
MAGILNNFRNQKTFMIGGTNVKKALLVGINNYPDAPLSGCISDAVELAKILATNEDGSPNFSVRSITDDQHQITKGSLRRNIKELFEDDNDVALLYFSGHGFVNAIGGYIVTPDYSNYDEGINMDEILTLANNSPARNKVIILDCCHSGTFGNPTITGSDRTILGQNLTILTACKSQQVAVEKEGQGLFTGLLIEALGGGAADLCGNATAGSVYWYVDKALGPWDQRPVFKTNVSAYVPLRTMTPPIPLELLRGLPLYFDSPSAEHRLDPSYEFMEKSAKPENVKVFKELQKLESVGIVKPVGEEHMYFAAIHSQSCRLTALGQCYWRFAVEGKI